MTPVKPDVDLTERLATRFEIYATIFSESVCHGTIMGRFGANGTGNLVGSWHGSPKRSCF